MGRAYQNRKESMAKTAATKTAVYSRYSREIYMAAKGGGTDPSANLTLRSLIDRAKKDQVPRTLLIRRSIKPDQVSVKTFKLRDTRGLVRAAR